MRVVVDQCGMLPSRNSLAQVFEEKYTRDYGLGWSPRLRKNFGYFTPDDYYETLVSNMVQNSFYWADVGCGRDVFPGNVKLARKLADRVDFLLGIDPSPNILENPFLTERFHGPIEEYKPDSQFDIITLRMVAEHIVDPDMCVAKLSSMTKRGGLVIIYTPNKWSPVSILARLLPFWSHHMLKQIVWQTEEKDSFPVAYNMNTRIDLIKRFSAHGLSEIMFAYLDDCRVTTAYKRLNAVELWSRRAFFRDRLAYPENCLLAVYRKL
jgi:hypothetical protein